MQCFSSPRQCAAPERCCRNDVCERCPSENSVSWMSRLANWELEFDNIGVKVSCCSGDTFEQLPYAGKIAVAVVV